MKTNAYPMDTYIFLASGGKEPPQRSGRSRRTGAGKMKKYIKSTRSNLVYEIERQSFTEKFRTPEDYFTHATRSVWYSTTGFNMFVQYKGAFYMIDRTDAHGYITSLEFVEISAEQAAAIAAERTAELMSEAEAYERNTVNAAIEYDAESATEYAKQAEFNATVAESYARRAAEYAAEAGTSAAASAADTAAEYAAFTRSHADRATETAEQAAAEAAQRAAWMKANPEQAAYIENEAAAHQWSAEETASAIEYRAAIRKANRAALALLDAYAEAIGEHPAEDDPETHAAYKVARDEFTGTSQRASEYDRETIALMVEAITRAARPADIVQYADMHYLVWTRAEVLAYIGDPTAYDVDAILQDIEETGASLADAAERHELYQYAPVA